MATLKTASWHAVMAIGFIGLTLDTLNDLELHRNTAYSMHLHPFCRFFMRVNVLVIIRHECHIAHFGNGRDIMLRAFQ